MTGNGAILKTSLIAALVGLATLPSVGSQTSASPVLTFDHKTGNEWWVEVVIGGPEAAEVVKVEAMDTMGPWVGLTQRSWGAWAQSFHIEPGHRVMFRATMSDGGRIDSCWFTHPQGVQQCDAPQPFAPSFGWPSGNHWWIQIDVDADRPLAGVDARVNGTEWRPLLLQSWGEWAASFHMPTGSKIQVRARASDGSVATHHMGFVWPQADPHPRLGDIPEMRFENIKGNAWWLQVNVYSNKPIKGVDARVGVGAWMPLRQQSFGDWAGSINAPEGATVQFRATSDESLTSGCFRWVSATPAPCPDTGAWPREGSHVAYRTHSSQSVPGYYRIADSDIRLVYRNGVWQGTCEATTQEGREQDGVYQVEYDNGTKSVDFRPLVQPDGAPGEPVYLPQIDRCTVSTDAGEATSAGTHALRIQGRTLTIPVARATEPEGNSAYQDYYSYANQATGLSLRWDLWRMHSRDQGELTDTDAPLGPSLDAAQQRAIQGTWPVEGSYVVQTWCKRASPEAWCTGANWTSQRFEYHGGAWVGTRCVGHIDGVALDAKPTGSRPAFGASGAVGAAVRVDRLEGCGANTTELVVRPTMPVGTNTGACCPYSDPTFVEAWIGQAPSWSDKDKDAAWDVESGLLLDMHYGLQQVWLDESDIRLV